MINVIIIITRLTIGLGDTFNFILLLNGIRVGGSTRGIDEFLGQTLGHGLQIAKGGLPGAGGQQVEGIIDATKGGHIDGLSSNDSGATDARGVFAGTGIENGVHDDLNGILVREQVNDLERVLDDADGHEFFAGVASFFHQADGEAFHDGTRGFAEALLGVATGRVWQVGGVVALAGDVVLLRIQRRCCDDV